MRIEIPDLLAERLAQDGAIEAAVKTTLHRFDPWLAASGMPFFPDFTDHGPDHLNRVLRLAEVLIRRDEEGRLPRAFTAVDAGTLLQAVLLHDLGMHLTEEGFLRLLSRDNPWPRIEVLDNRSWIELWAEFCAEATRWDSRTLVRLFGDELANRPEKQPLIRRPEELPTSAWDEMDRRLIGEFVRCHHPRIAHEIARFGVPGPRTQRLEIERAEVCPEVADLAGFVARSHGMALRDTFDYLKREFGSHREFRDTHPVFTMVVLRIADYLDLFAERAPGTLQLVKRQKSAKSKREWEAHQAIRDIALNTEEDPELLRLTAKPRKIEPYLRIREWQHGLQVELDHSWAVLGEVYGRWPQLRSLNLSIRRVQSNLDELAFRKEVDFVPNRISVGLAHSEILGLMVRPLYGNRPEFGIRELIQNSVDAVRERELFVAQHPDFMDLGLHEQEGNVVIWVGKVEDGRTWVEVTDRGIGMTEEVVCNYFLKAGASFRNSSAWKREFELAGTGGMVTRSKVLRSGRFGVGVLAAYLLGDRVQVETRHLTVGRDDGLAFSVELLDDTVSIKKKVLPIGTRIRIAISNEMLSRLIGRPGSWDWYCLESPSVIRRVGAEGRILSQTLKLPPDCGALPKGWYRLESTRYLDVQWSYESSNSGVVCNGIEVERGHSESLIESMKITKWQTLRPPLISIFDPDGMLPTNLVRDRMFDDPDLTRRLREEVTKNLLAFLLVVLPPRRASTRLRQLAEALKEISSHPQSNDVISYITPIVTPDGYTLLIPELLSKCGVERLVLFDEAVLGKAAADINALEYLLGDQPGDLVLGRGVYAEGASNWEFIPPVNAEDLMKVLPNARGIRFITSDESISPSGPAWRRSWVHGRWSCYTRGECGERYVRENSFDESSARYAPHHLDSAPSWVGEFELDRVEDTGSEDGMAFLNGLLKGAAQIPYDIEERRGRLSHLYESLSQYIERYQS
jgi:hypothetical protein